MTKDYLQFRNAIKKDKNLNLEEAYLLEVLFDYYNVQLGYAFPSYEVLMEDLKTKRRAKISKILKSLAKKGYISIKKNGKKNTYYILKYLFLSKSKSKVKQKDHAPVDSNGYIPVDGQIHVEDFLNTKEQQEVIEITKFNEKQAAELLKAASNNLEKIVQAFEYAKSKGKAVFAYVRWCIKNLDVSELIIKKKKDTVKADKFNNFEPRQYDYNKLEKMMLGWDNETSLKECMI